MGLELPGWLESSNRQPDQDPLEHPRGLIAEGRDELRLMQLLMRDGPHRVSGRYVPHGSVKLLFPAMLTQKVVERITHLGILYDAETEGATKVLATLRAALRERGLPVPDKPQVTKTEGQVSVRILISPPGQEQGMLEDVLWPQVRESPFAECVDEFLECVERKRGKPLARRSKTGMRCFIATGNDDNTGINAALQANILTVDHAALEPYRQLARFLLS
jgi:hypothetical protein